MGSLSGIVEPIFGVLVVLASGWDQPVHAAPGASPPARWSTWWWRSSSPSPTSASTPTWERSASSRASSMMVLDVALG